MSEQHTPAPWRYYDENPNMAASIVAFGKTVAHIYLTKGEEGEDAANARLIAAAPELYAALNAALDGLRRASRQLTEDHKAVLNGKAWGGLLIDNAEAALAQARGDA